MYGKPKIKLRTPGLNVPFSEMELGVAYGTGCNARFICCSQQSAARALGCGMTHTKGSSLWPAMECNTYRVKEQIDWIIWFKGITGTNETASQMSFSHGGV